MEDEIAETVILNIGKEVDQTTQRHIEVEVETKGPKPHNGEKIDNFFMSEDELFAVTYSEADKSVVGWLVNVKTDKLQQLGTCPNLELTFGTKFVLHEKDLLLYNEYSKYANLISFNSDNVIARRIRVEIKFNLIGRFSMGFLPNGDLILAASVVRLMDHMIFLYPRANLSSPQLLYKIKFQSSNKYEVNGFIYYYIFQTKLFIFNDGCLSQWDLSSFSSKTPKKKMHYNLTSNRANYIIDIVINKNQTLLASCVLFFYEGGGFKTDIYSMKTGKHISRYG